MKSKPVFKAMAMAEPYILERVLSLMEKTPKKSTILDIATGQGYMAERLHHLGFKNVFTADLTDKNFKLNKSIFHFKQVDANQKLPYKNSSFGVVISSETIEHLENPKHFMQEINRILKPGGLFILSTPSVENIISRIYFLFTGVLAFHTDRDYRLTGH